MHGRDYARSVCGLGLLSAVPIPDTTNPDLYVPVNKGDSGFWLISASCFGCFGTMFNEDCLPSCYFHFTCFDSTIMVQYFNLTCTLI